MHLSRSSSNVPRLPTLLKLLQMHNPLCLPRKTTSGRPKWSEHVVFLTLWLGNVLCTTTACIFLDISTSGASDLQFWEDDFVWQVQQFVWVIFSWQAQYFRDMGCKNRKTHWYEAVSSALNFPLLKEVSQNCFAFDVANLKNWGSLAELLRFQACR